MLEEGGRVEVEANTVTVSAKEGFAPKNGSGPSASAASVVSILCKASTSDVGSSCPSSWESMAMEAEVAHLERLLVNIR